MKVIGIDPGARNSGIALLEDGVVKKFKTITTKSGDWREAFQLVIAETKKLGEANLYVIESVSWFGARRGMYALNRLVGALWVWCTGGEGYGEVLLVQPKDKVKITAKYKKGTKTEHERDAIALALVGFKEDEPKLVGKSNPKRQKNKNGGATRWH